MITIWSNKVSARSVVTNISAAEQLDLLLAPRWRDQTTEQPKLYIVVEDPGASRYRPVSIGVRSLITPFGLGNNVFSPSIGASTLRDAGGVMLGNFRSYAVSVPLVGPLVRHRVYREPVNATLLDGVQVLDRRPGDAALIQTTPSVAAALLSAGVEVIEDVPFYPAVARPPLRRRKVAPGTPQSHVKIIVKSALGRRLRGVTVVGVMADFSVDWRRTASGGTAMLNATGTELMHLFVDPAPDHWSWSARDVQPVDGCLEVTLKAVAPRHIDALRQRYSAVDLEAGAGVVVGVIDTGVGPHPDLTVQGGRSYALGPVELPWTAGDSPHGTHVAGIIASRAEPPRRGIAPGVELRSYRVYEDDEVGLSFSLSAAIRDAVDDGCDVINLSMEFLTNEHQIKSRIEHAVAEGVIVVVAAGNGGRQPLSFPASVDGVVAVGALGRRGTYPRDSASTDSEAEPTGTDPDDYVAGFSNRVRHEDVAAPGVGTISTLPDGKWGVMDGTSQAAPVVTALVARILAETSLVRQSRSLARAHAVLKELREGNLNLGFSSDLVGKGLVVNSGVSL